MYVFKSDFLDKQIAGLKNRNDLGTRLNTVIQKLRRYETIDELYKDKALGFKKYKGLSKSVYGIDLGLPGSATTAGERLIVSIINLFDNTLFRKTVEYREPAHNKPTVLLHLFCKHDDQNREASNINESDISAFLKTRELSDLKCSLEADAQFREIVTDDYFASGVTVLSLDKDEIVDRYCADPAPTILQGVAGSGKTEVLIKLIQTIAYRNPEARILYVTNSENLVNEVERRVSLPGKSRSVRTFISLLRHYLPASKQTAEPEDFNFFCHFLKTGLDFNFRQKIHRFLETLDNDYYRLYCEVYGLIFGNMLPAWDRHAADMLPFDEYLSLPKDYRLFPGDEDTVYMLAKRYYEYTKAAGLLSVNAESFRLIKKTGTPYDYVFIDEVQDFTQCQLAWLVSLAKDSHLFLCGDIKQIINPTFFEFGHLKRLLTVESDRIYDLRANFRNSASVTELVNSLNDIRHEHLTALKIEDRQSESSGTPVPGNVYNYLGTPDALIEYFDGPEDAVIVDESRLAKLQAEGMDTTNLFAPRQCKGLEFDNVCAYNLLSDKFGFFETIIHGKTKDHSLHYHFNLYYVAITRSKNCLALYEQKSLDFYKILLDPTSSVFEAFVPEEIEKAADKSAKQYILRANRLMDASLFDKALANFKRAKTAIDADEFAEEIEVGIKAADIYTRTKGDLNLALAFENSALYSFAYKHYRQLNDYGAMCMMLLLDRKDDEFAAFATDNGLNLFELGKRKPLYETAVHDYITRRFRGLAPALDTMTEHSLRISDAMHAIHL